MSIPTERKVSSREAPKFVVRFDDTVTRDRMHQIARDRKRSSNAEILVALNNHISAFDNWGNSEKLIARIGQLSKDDRALVEAFVSRLAK